MDSKRLLKAIFIEIISISLIQIAYVHELSLPFFVLLFYIGEILFLVGLIMGIYVFMSAKEEDK